MKIILIGNNAGGMANFRGALIKELQRQNHEVCVAVPNNPTEPKQKEIFELGVKIIWTSMDRRGQNIVKDFRVIREYYAMLKREKPDLVVTYTIKPNVYAGIACRLLKIPFAANITGLGTAFQKKNALQAVVSVLYLVSIRKARIVFFENEENRDILVKKRLVRKEKTHVLHGAGVEPERFVYQDYPQGDDTHFLFMGRLMKEKGVEELLTATKRLHEENANVHLDLLGRLEEDFREAIETAQEEGWLTYHGVQNDVRPYIAASHCFVLPSWHEGMANTNLECAASGRPVITSNIHGCMEAVEDGVTGFLCRKKDPEDLYRVMKAFTEMPYEQRKAMGVAGRKRMEEIFDKKKVVAETIRNMMGENEND